MGFSPQQARVALAATDTGLDVQAALETLLTNGAGSSSLRSSPQPQSRRGDHQLQRESEEADVQDAISTRQRIPQRRDRQREPPHRGNSAITPDSQRNIQDQANELLAQASTIGLSMFNRANALWKEGKEKVQRVYEERASVVAPSTSSAFKQANDTRPKWMQDGPEDDQPTRAEIHDTGSSFRDEHDVVDIPIRRREEQTRAHRSATTKPVNEVVSLEPGSSKGRTGDLLVDDAPKVYVSPYRRKGPSRSQVSTQQESRSGLLSASAPPPLVQRKCVSASPSELASSAKHKSTGTEMFKLGRFAEAETAYTHSIAALPDSHLLLVPLYNNRALTRIKNGDYSGAIDDCTTALKIIGPGYHPSREAKVTKEDEGANVDLADAYVKALRRRAEAYEGKEKWQAAKDDWEAIIATEWAVKSRNEAIQAAGRCRRMVGMNAGEATGQDTSSSAVKPKPKPRPKPVTFRSVAPSEALKRVREANQAAEAEDQEKYACKDQVDARLMAWKSGKENNIRALIASLDTVLWPELGLQKVGMHELVTPSQVKIRYTKAIAKLHPDKVCIGI